MSLKETPTISPSQFQSFDFDKGAPGMQINPDCGQNHV